MNEKPVSIWKRQFLPGLSPTRFVRWLFSWRTIKRGLFGAACLATLVAIFYAEENWRGRREWEKYKSEWEAKGEKLDWAAVIPPPVPDNQNFAMAPFWEDSRYRWAENKKGVGEDHDTNRMNRLAHLQFNIYRTGRGKPNDPAMGSWETGSNTDLKVWQGYYRAPVEAQPGGRATASTNEFPVPAQPGPPAADVLLALGKYQDTLELLREASRRSQARFPINYEDGPSALLPHLAKLKATCSFLDLHSVAELEAGQNQQAFDDVNLMFHAADAVNTEPFLISYLVRIACREMTLRPVWEGLANRRWSEAQLRSFQEKISSYDLLADFEGVCRGERAFAVAALDDLASKRMASQLAAYGQETLSRNYQPRGEKERWAAVEFALYLGLAPRGWLDRDKIVHSEWIGEQMAAFHPASQSVDFERVKALKSDFSGAFLLHFFYEYRLLGLEAAEQAVRAQTALNLGAVACALERYSMANGAYPERLDELVPKFIEKLPHEIVTGGPLKYRKSGDGRFVLYSTGLEGKDSGGVFRGPDKKLTGNWVWRYPAK